MTRPLILEDFAALAQIAEPLFSIPEPDTDVGHGTNEEDKLAAFDAGYKNGWDDCAAAEAETGRKVGASLATNLQDISMTYAEARLDVMKSLAPLFEEIASQLLPVLAAEAVAPTILAELAAAADDATAPVVTLIAAPAAIPKLERLLDSEKTISVTLKSEPAFAEGQVSVRFENERRDINLGEAADRMAEAIRSYVELEINGASPAFDGNTGSGLQRELAS